MLLQHRPPRRVYLQWEGVLREEAPIPKDIRASGGRLRGYTLRSSRANDRRIGPMSEAPAERAQESRAAQHLPAEGKEFPQSRSTPRPCSTSSKRAVAELRDGPQAPGEDNDMMVDLLGQLEHSYKTRIGYWKGGTVWSSATAAASSRASRRWRQCSRSREFHTLRVHAAGRASLHDQVLRKLATLGQAGLRPDRLPRPVRQHHVPGRLRERAALPSTRSTSSASTSAAPGRGAHRHVVRRRGALRAVLLRRARRTGRSSTTSSTTCTARRCRTSSSSSSPAARTTA